MAFPYNTRTATVITTTAAFATNQVIGTGIQSFNNIDPQGMIQSVQININSTNASQIDFCMFTSSMPNTTFTDHAAIAISSADFAAQGPVVNVTPWNYMGLNAANSFVSGLANAYPPVNTPNMYWTLIARGALTVNSTNGVYVAVTFVS